MQAIQRLSQVSLLIAAILVWGCGSSRLTTRQAGEQLKPIAALPEREQAQMQKNLIIRIENVADNAGSYKNYATLRINGREITPDKAISNMTANYDYALRVPYGVYEIEGDYHVVGFWKEASYPIRVDEPVKVMPGKVTMVTTYINKDTQGFPAQKNLYFILRYKDAVEEARTPAVEAKTAPAIAPREPEITKREAIGFQEVLRQPAPVDDRSAGELLPVNSDKIILQINTTPSNAEVIVDDRFCGNAPLRIAVSRNERHVVQVSRAGFDDLLRIVEPQELGSEKVVQLVFKMDRVTGIEAQPLLTPKTNEP